MRNDNHPYHKIHKADHPRILALYESGLRTGQIAEQYGVANTRINQLVKGYGRQQPGRTSRRLALREDAFSDDTEGAMYWAGIMAADGYVQGHSGFCLGLQEKDRDHIYKFREFLGSEAKVYYRRPQSNGFRLRNTRAAQNIQYEILAKGQYSIHIRSVKVVAVLKERFNITPAKTATYAPKDGIDSPHFWRGMVDGDGTLFVSHKDSSLHMSLCGTEATVGAYREFLLNAGVPTKAKIIRHAPNGSLFMFSLGSRMAIRAATTLYGECTIFLERKKQIADRFIKPLVI